MNIVILADSFLPYICGVTTHTVELTRGLIQQGHHVLIFAPKYKESTRLPKELKKARIVYLTSVPSTYQNLRICAPSFYRIARELSTFHPDIFYAQNPSILSFEAQQFAKLFSIPFVGSFHTLYASDAYLKNIFKTKYATKLKPGIWTILRLFYNASDHIIVPTPSIRSHVIKNGLKKKRLSVLPSLLDIEQPVILNQAQKATLKKKYALRNYVAGFVGRLTPEKNIPQLLKVWAKVVSEMPESSLLLIGGAGTYQKEIDRMIRKYKLSGSVICTGAIEHDRLISSGILSILDVFVSTSTTETFGLSMVESMAYGVPVVTPPASGMIDVVGDAGIVSKHNTIRELSTSILTLLTDKKLHKTLGARAQRRALHYSGKTGVQDYIRTFERIIETHERPLAFPLRFTRSTREEKRDMVS